MTKKDLLKIRLPDRSGVYFFLDKKIEIDKPENFSPKKENILYIGKATNLKDRVSSYFREDLFKSRGVKLVSMLENAKDIFFIETKNVLEAIILETNLIKKYTPFFNSKEKDDKSYSYVIFVKEKFPRVLIIRGREIKQDLNLKVWKKFGPFISKNELVEIMKTLRKIFPFRDKCKIGEKRGCFNFMLKLCPGVCINKISEKDYLKNLKNLEKILVGKTENLFQDLEKEMFLFSKKQDFEKAKIIRDKIFALKYLNDISLIKDERDEIKILENNFLNKKNEEENLFRIESYDVSHTSGKNRVGAMSVLENFEIKKNEYRKFKLKESLNDDLRGLQEILERRFRHKEWKFPNLIVIDGGKTHLKFAYKILMNIFSKKELSEIIFTSVLKDEKHKAKEIIYLEDVDKSKKIKYNKYIILANIEVHNFALKYHKRLKNKIF